MSWSADSLGTVETNPHWLGCACTLCGRTYGRDYAGFVCEDCGIDGILDATYDLQEIKKSLPAGDPFPALAAGGQWRFAPLLPLHPQSPHPAWTLPATPVHFPGHLAKHLGLKSLVLKDDTHLPSASLKDRAATLAIARARQLGLDHIACASTGNAAASLAVLAARAGIRCTIFVPASAPRAKMAQLLLHGATVVPINGTYDQAFDYSLQQIAKNSWYSRNCAHNPLLVEAKKTGLLELMATLTHNFTASAGNVPDAVFVPVGDGCIVSSVAKALTELHALDIIDRLPRVIGVQAAGAGPLAAGWQNNQSDPATMSGTQIVGAIQPITPHTIADSISVGIPRNRVKAWQYVARTRGDFVAVEDQEILEAIALLANRAGVFAEPSGAAGLAGVVKALATNIITPDDKVAVMVTGNGLKDAEAALGLVDVPAATDPA